MRLQLALKLGLSRVRVGGASVQPKATGGTIKLHNGYWYHVFNSTDDFVPTQALGIDYVVVSSGGNSQNKGSVGTYCSGGGGAGGVLLGENVSVTPSTIPVTIRAVGLACTLGLPTPIEPAVGGNGGSPNNAGGAGGSGGGAGGCGIGTRLGGTGIAGQGKNGGSTVGSGNACPGGAGGGGYGTEGLVINTSSDGGAGGDGLDLNTLWGLVDGLVDDIVIGDAGWFAGGGAGGSNSAVVAPGGKGGGGAGGNNAADNAANGMPNTGGGAGAPGNPGLDQVGKNGGIGVVIVRYAA